MQCCVLGDGPRQYDPAKPWKFAHQAGDEPAPARGHCLDEYMLGPSSFQQMSPQIRRKAGLAISRTNPCTRSAEHPAIAELVPKEPDNVPARLCNHREGNGVESDDLFAYGFWEITKRDLVLVPDGTDFDFGFRGRGATGDTLGHA